MKWRNFRGGCCLCVNYTISSISSSASTSCTFSSSLISTFTSLSTRPLTSSSSTSSCNRLITIYTPLFRIYSLPGKVVDKSSSVSRCAQIMVFASSCLCVSSSNCNSVGSFSESSSGNSSDVHRGSNSDGRRLIFSGERRREWDAVSKQQFLRLTP